MCLVSRVEKKREEEEEGEEEEKKKKKKKKRHSKEKKQNKDYVPITQCKQCILSDSKPHRKKKASLASNKNLSCHDTSTYCG